MIFRVSKCLLIVIFFSCNVRSVEVFGSLIPEGKGIIMSCVRCGCMDEALLKFYKDPKRINSFPLFIDSNCAPHNIKVRYQNLPQKQLDSLFEDNFNLILYKTSGKKVILRVIQTSEAPIFPDIVDSFFVKPQAK